MQVFGLQLGVAGSIPSNFNKVFAFICMQSKNIIVTLKFNTVIPTKLTITTMNTSFYQLSGVLRTLFHSQIFRLIKVCGLLCCTVSFIFYCAAHSRQKAQYIEEQIKCIICALTFFVFIGIFHKWYLTTLVFHHRRNGSYNKQSVVGSMRVGGAYEVPITHFICPSVYLGFFLLCVRWVEYQNLLPVINQMIT